MTLILCFFVQSDPPYPIVDTSQTAFFDDRGTIERPASGKPFFGQDASYGGARASYRDNGNGTVSDLVTGLMWTKEPSAKMIYADAVAGAKKCRVGGHSDWRLPSVKELYSLIDFRGNSRKGRAYLDAKLFDFHFGDEDAGERPIDAQYWTSTEYVGKTMEGDATVFGVNFADGRIKGYPRDRGPRGRPFQAFVRYVRGNPKYGINDFVDNRDGTITDRATGLTWQQGDGAKAMNWKDALAYAEELELAGHSDWRLPNAKELQSLVDYRRAPDAEDDRHRGPAIDPIFRTTSPEAWYWTGTTHLEGPGESAAVYLAFGRAMGYMERPPGSGRFRYENVHGAGAQRSDPKSGDPSRYPHGLGPQGDEVRILLYVRCVR